MRVLSTQLHHTTVSQADDVAKLWIIVTSGCILTAQADCIAARQPSDGPFARARGQQGWLPGSRPPLEGFCRLCPQVHCGTACAGKGRIARGPLSRRGDHAACYRCYLHRAGPTSARTTKSEPPAHQRCSLRLRPRPACLGPLGGLFRSPRGQLIISSEGPHLDGFVSIQVTMVLAISKISQRRGSR